MKKLFILCTVFVLIAGCSQDELAFEEQNAEEIQGGVVSAEREELVVFGDLFSSGGSSGPSLLTSFEIDDLGPLLKWSPGDKIGVCKVINSFNDYRLSLNSPFTVKSGVISNAMFTGDILESGNYRAYYPYSPEALSDGKVLFALPEQIQSANGNYDHFGACDFVYTADPVPFTEGDNQTLNFRFKHAFSFFVFTIENTSDRDVLLQEIEMENTKLGQFSFATKLEMTSTGDSIRFVEAENKISLKMGNGIGHSLPKGGVYRALMVLAAPYGMEAEFRFKTDQGIYSYVKNMRELKGGYYYTVSADFSGGFELNEWDGQSVRMPRIINNEITIFDAEELAWMAGVSNKTIKGAAAGGVNNKFTGYTINLARHLDLGAGKYQWAPIADRAAYAFEGDFNGNNYTVKSLTMDYPEGDNKGLFGHTATVGRIHNLNIEGGFVKVGKSYVGAFVGFNRGVIDHCHNLGCDVSSENAYAGGIVGRNEGHYVIACSNTGRIETKGNYAGGIVGLNGRSDVSESYIVACYNTGEVLSRNLSGGIAGRHLNENAYIMSCINFGKVNSQRKYGEILGDFSKGGVVTHCLHKHSSDLCGNEGGRLGECGMYNDPNSIREELVDLLNGPLKTSASSPRSITSGPKMDWHWMWEYSPGNRPNLKRKY